MTAWALFFGFVVTCCTSVYYSGDVTMEEDTEWSALYVVGSIVVGTDGVTCEVCVWV